MGKREEAELRAAFGSDNSLSSCLIGSVAPAKVWLKTGLHTPKCLLRKWPDYGRVRLSPQGCAQLAWKKLNITRCKPSNLCYFEAIFS